MLNSLNPSLNYLDSSLQTQLNTEITLASLRNSSQVFFPSKCDAVNSLSKIEFFSRIKEGSLETKEFYWKVYQEARGINKYNEEMIDFCFKNSNAEITMRAIKTASGFNFTYNPSRKTMKLSPEITKEVSPEFVHNFISVVRCCYLNLSNGLFFGAGITRGNPYYPDNTEEAEKFTNLIYQGDHHIIKHLEKLLESENLPENKPQIDFIRGEINKHGLLSSKEFILNLTSENLEAIKNNGLTIKANEKINLDSFVKRPLGPITVTNITKLEKNYQLNFRIDDPVRALIYWTEVKYSELDPRYSQIQFIQAMDILMHMYVPYELIKKYYPDYQKHLDQWHKQVLNMNRAYVYKSSIQRNTDGKVELILDSVKENNPYIDVLFKNIDQESAIDIYHAAIKFYEKSNFDAASKLLEGLVENAVKIKDVNLITNIKLTHAKLNVEQGFFTEAVNPYKSLFNKKNLGMLDGIPKTELLSHKLYYAEALTKCDSPIYTTAEKICVKVQEEIAILAEIADQRTTEILMSLIGKAKEIKDITNSYLHNNVKPAPSKTFRM